MEEKKFTLYLQYTVSEGIMIVDNLFRKFKIIITPRTKLREISEHCEKPGVYFLIGSDPENSYKDIVYIGSGNNVSKRLNIQKSEEENDFWETTIIIVGDDRLSTEHVQYLESQMINRLREAEVATVKNAQTPRPRPLHEEDEFKLFIDNIDIFLRALGFKFLRPKIKTGLPDSENIVYFTLKEVHCDAIDYERNGEFIVEKGSTARKKGTGTWPSSYKKFRDQLVEDKKLKEDPNDPERYIFTDDIAFKSPSYAAYVVAACSINGIRAWKVKGTDQSLADFVQ